MAQNPSAKGVDWIVKNKVKVQDLLQILDCRSQIERALKVQSKILNLKSTISLRLRIDA